MLLYSKYCAKYTSYVDKCEKLLNPNSTKDSELVKLMSKHKYSGSFVQGVLVSPIQRITRYQLLFNEYLKECRKLSHTKAETKKMDMLLEGLNEMVCYVDSKSTS